MNDRRLILAWIVVLTAGIFLLLPGCGKGKDAPLTTTPYADVTSPSDEIDIWDPTDLSTTDTQSTESSTPDGEKPDSQNPGKPSDSGTGTPGNTTKPSDSGTGTPGNETKPAQGNNPVGEGGEIELPVIPAD